MAYDINACITINTLERAVNPAARPSYPPGVVSSTTWSASPAGQLSNGGRLVPSLPDATIAERTACANNAKRPLS
jgi:hypothetical protein